MRRGAKYLGCFLLVLIGVALQLVLIVGLVANTNPGRRAIEELAPALTGGEVRIEGLRGRFPDKPRIHRLTVADADGVWLTVDDAILDWWPRRLAGGTVKIDRLEAHGIALGRLPRSSDGNGGGAFPAVRIELGHLGVQRLEIAAAVAGRLITLAVDGSGQLTGPENGDAHLTITALDSGGVPARGPVEGAAEGGAPDHYIVDASIDPAQVHATVSVAERSGGLISDLAGLPDLGSVAIAGTVDGPLGTLAAKASIRAGPLRADLNGTVNAVERQADLAVSVVAPAMTPGPGISWASIKLNGTVHGPWDAPEANGTVLASDLTAGGASIGSMRADLAGNATGETTLHAVIDGLRVPGPSPDLLASGPLTMDATAQLREANWPVRFTLRHDLVSALGTADAGTGDAATGDAATGDAAKGEVSLTIPDLSPFAAIAGVDVSGSGHFDVAATRSKDAIAVTVRGGIGVTGGTDPIPALVGDAGTVDLAASISGQDVKLTKLELSGHAFRALANGQYIDRRLAADWTVALTDPGVLRPGVSGSVEARGHAAGTPEALSVRADLTGSLAGDVGSLDHFTVHAEAKGLPDAPEGQVTASGTVLDAPLDVSLSAARGGAGTHVAIERAVWKSLSARGTMDFTAGVALPTGQISATVGRLEDISAPFGRPVTGQLTSSLEVSPARMVIRADATRAGVARTGSVTQAQLRAAVTDPAAKPAIDATLSLDGIEGNGISGAARVAAKGPLDGVAVIVTASGAAVHGMPARIETQATLNTSASTVLLASLQAALGPETIRLLAPARIGYGGAVTIDKLRLGLRQGEMTFAGRVNERPVAGGLNMTATLTGIPADVLASFAPDYAADGTIAGEAHLTGALAHPAGTIRLTASGLRMRSGPGRGLPPAGVTVGATLDGAGASIDARLNAGTSAVTVSGRAPLDVARPMDLRIGGNLDLAMLNPLIAAQGRQVKGRLVLALAAGGTVTAPRATGTVGLTGGDLLDVTVGAHVSEISAAARLDGDTIRLERLEGKAGDGTISGAGTVALAGSPAGSPAVDLSLRASNAKLLASDLVTAVADANLTLRGPIDHTPTLAGTVRTRRVDVQVPETLPSSIAVLPLRNPPSSGLTQAGPAGMRRVGTPGARPPASGVTQAGPAGARQASGEPAASELTQASSSAARPAGTPGAKPPPPAPPPDIALNLTLDAPDQIYVRGRGIDAELGGRIVFAGTAANPLPQGGLKLRRGTFSLAGEALNFTEGTIDFSGASVTNPSLKFVATSANAALTATLTISGDVRDPKIVLSSVPDMPQDEILSQLLFNTTTSRLSPFQAAEIAAALASLSGISGPGSDPLGRVRSALGLDQLSVGSASGGGAALQAGRYIARGVRIGASQSTGGQTQATVQIDITKGLKLQGTAAAGAPPPTPVPGVDYGSSVGITYQFEY
jgi:translocation and assembly module TamB